jgi:DNA-binding CsgD family transcriptional regulator
VLDKYLLLTDAEQKDFLRELGQWSTAHMARQFIDGLSDKQKADFYWSEIAAFRSEIIPTVIADVIELLRDAPPEALDTLYAEARAKSNPTGHFLRYRFSCPKLADSTNPSKVVLVFLADCMSRTCEIEMAHQDPPPAAVSRNHALLVKREDQCLIRDQGSRNGTFVNGIRIDSETFVIADDEIRIGIYRLQLRLRLCRPAVNSGDDDEVTRSDFNDPVPHASSRVRIALTPAQRRVHMLLLQGLMEKEVAASLGISVNTVHWHAKAIYRALGVSTRVELMAMAMSKQPRDTE